MSELTSRAMHTPGPWRASTAGFVYSATAKDRHGRDLQVAVCQGLSFVEAIANARLIAAAPELLAALRPFANLGVGPGPDDEPDLATYRILRGAIRKARTAIAAAEARTA